MGWLSFWQTWRLKQAWLRCDSLAGGIVVHGGECIECGWQGGVAGPACWAQFSAVNLDLFEWNKVCGPKWSIHPHERICEVLFVSGCILELHFCY